MKPVPVIVLGVGGVGRALLQQIVESREAVAGRAGCRFDLIALADSRSWLWQPEGIDDAAIRRILEVKQQQRPVGPIGHRSQKTLSGLEILHLAATHGIEGAVLVDVTAADGMEPVIDRAIESGYSVALANKKALAGPWATAGKYYNHPRIRHESTVGGGQPVIATLRYLLDVKDSIHQIEGQLSGTLGFICSRLDQAIPYSEAIAEAKERGFTEPDPREDLAGNDVMRKVMILGRMAGWPLEETDITVDSLFPPALAALSVSKFMQSTSGMDAAMRQRVERVARDGKVLRYVARVERGGGEVGLKELPADSPLAGLKYVSFRTGRYNDEPLIIGGKGAGVEMTAAGVLGDMISLVRESNS
jgi:homoserine dehydrogenase